MRTFTKIIFIVFLTLSTVGCDQSTKYFAIQYLEPIKKISYVNDMFRLQYAENSGAFLGFGSEFSDKNKFIIFTIFVSLILCGLVFYLIKNIKKNTMNSVGISLILSGGVSNLFDRITNNGVVVDFMNVGIGSLRTGIFNFADVFVLLGVAVLLFFSRKKVIN